ncbi:MAG TPA: hypothetical protein PKA53_00205 [Sphingobacterium sp.]|nr:hypothetical protein [Sphingobacterium sp.]
MNLLKELTAIKGEPCISLYMKTHRQHPESALDPIAFKKLYKKTLNYIQEHQLTAHEPLLAPLEKLIDDKTFWDNGDNGLAIFCSARGTKILKLPKDVQEISCVANSFCVKPLFSFYNENQKYYLLALGLDSVKLYQGDKYRIEEVNIEGKIPTSMKEALGHELTDNHLHASVIQGTGLHGYMEKSQEEEIDMDRFFRKIDHAIQEHFDVSKETPLLVATLPEHQRHFLRVSKNPHMTLIPLHVNPHALNKDELLERVQEVLMDNFEKHKKTLLDKSQLALQENLSSTELRDVVQDALDGKIDILFIENDRTVNGYIDPEHRKVQQQKALSTDVINELSCLVFEQGGHVIVLDSDEMLVDTGAFTINRY